MGLELLRFTELPENLKPGGLDHAAVYGGLGRLYVAHTANDSLELSGPPDVIFFSQRLRHLYVAIGDPGVVDVFETDRLTRIETIQTELGAHTIGFDAERNKIFAFLPKTHRVAAFLDRA